MPNIYDVFGNLIVKGSQNIKILGIGNSYTRDSMRWVWKILKELGFDSVTIGYGYLGAATLSEQYSNRESANLEYWKYTTTQNASKTANTSLHTIVNDEPWDVVVFQQQSDDAGQYSSFVSGSFDINDFVTWVKSILSNDVRIGIALTWSHAQGYNGAKFISYYNGSVEAQWTAIKSVIPQVADHMSQCDFVVNVGYAIEYGRSNTYLEALGDEMLRSDKNHLQYGIPSFMAGLVYVMTICNVQIEELTWYPTATDEGETCVTSEYLAYLAKQCAKAAVQTIA